MNRQLCVYVDVDATLVRSVSSKRIPISTVIKHVADLAHDGALLYCWSSGGAEYAQVTAKELGIEQHFAAFLPKPNVIIDDQEVVAWPQFVHVHPAATRTLEEYRSSIETTNTPR